MIPTITCPACKNEMICLNVLKPESLDSAYWCQFCGTFKCVKDETCMMTETGKYWKKILEDCELMGDDDDKV
jgi:hypothetical protein